MEALKLVQPGGPRALNLDAVNAQLADASAEDVVAWAAETFGEGLLMSSSFGAHSALMLHLAPDLVDMSVATRNVPEQLAAMTPAERVAPQPPPPAPE